MANVNRQTIYQMGNVVNDVVKQATGRDPVKAIEMAHVTVEQNTLLGIETLSGSVVRFRTPKSVPLLSLDAQIVARQDLHGYDYPWPAGGGVNKFLPRTTDASQTTINGLTWSYDVATEKYSVSGTNTKTDNPWFVTTSSTSTVPEFVAGETWYFSGKMPLGLYCQLVYTDTSNNIKMLSGQLDGNGDFRYKTFTVPEDYASFTQFQLGCLKTTGEIIEMTDMVFCLSKTAPTAWTPYANVSPITGFTGCNISVSGGDNPERIYPVEWETEAGTVYGGVLDAKNGKLTIDRKMYHWESGGSLSSSGAFVKQILDVITIDTTNQASLIGVKCDKLKSGTWVQVSITATNQYICSCSFFNGLAIRIPGLSTAEEYETWLSSNPLDIVYLLKEPVEYDVFPVSINTLAGDNVISADTGDISLSYYVYSDLL